MAGRPSASPIRLSVALVTRNRPESLRRTLASLGDQTTKPFEVVVSDDSDDWCRDDVRRIVAEFGHRYETGPRRGLYANRNYVASRCTGTHVRTMDDDHEFPPGHLAKCIAAVESDAGAVWFIGEFHEWVSDPSSVPICPGQLSPQGYSGEVRDPDLSWAIADGASIYPAEIFRRGLLFSEAFAFGAAYLEFGSRLFSMGYRMRFLRNTFVIHHYESGKRSYENPELQLSARVFAALCHSFLYQPTIGNVSLTCAELVRQLAKSGFRIDPIRRGLEAFWSRRNEHRAILNASHPATSRGSHARI